MAVEKSPIAWGLTPFKRYAEFSGRSSRAELWWFFLFLMIIYVVMWFLLAGSISGLAATGTEPSAGALQAMGGGMIILSIFWLAVLIPSIAVQVRRLHDTNRSGWVLGGFYLLYAIYGGLLFSTVMSTAFAPEAVAEPTGSFWMTMILGIAVMIYGIVLLVFYCLPGTTGDNRYGPDPYGADVAKVFA